MEHKGWLALHRKILDNGIMTKPPLHFKLWIWMLCKAQHHSGNSLEKGQFKTSIKEMQEAMAHYVGYRKITPSIKQIRGAYEGLTKDGMTDIMKGRHGLTITILNYKKLQAKKSE